MLYNLVATDAQDGRAEDRFGFAVYDERHQTLRLALFIGA